MATEGADRRRKLEVWGWCLFIASAVFFVASTVRSGDLLGLVGSLIFLFACIVFLVPCLRPPE
ncbi:MAG: hypothetical protein BMS9Abin01_1936 [Gammaproteobacteria bacterium]|nr:MAG: hypothetical protein BMS9Abin01_1936 [Gammaproteobacteria bacterium]